MPTPMPVGVFWVVILLSHIFYIPTSTTEPFIPCTTSTSYTVSDGYPTYPPPAYPLITPLHTGAPYNRRTDIQTQPNLGIYIHVTRQMIASLLSLLSLSMLTTIIRSILSYLYYTSTGITNWEEYGRRGVGGHESWCRFSAQYSSFAIILGYIAKNNSYFVVMRPILE